MHKIILIFTAFVMFVLLSCNKETSNPVVTNPNDTTNVDTTDPVSTNPIQWSFVGNINHDTWTPGQEAKVIFDRFPKTTQEFKELQDKMGKEPQGAVALEIMAMEMYRRNVSIGTECIKLANLSINVNSILNRLKELFGKDVNYARPYQMACFLLGSSPENGYNPSKPYTIEVKVNPTNQYENSAQFESKFLHLLIKSNGHDNAQQIVTIIKPAGSPNFLVSNCPGLYYQCKKIGYGQTFNGLN